MKKQSTMSKILCLFGLVAGLVMASWTPAISQQSGSGGTLAIAIRNVDYDTFDPHVSSFTQAAYVFRNIFDRLISLDANGNYVAGLAISWEASDDAKIWTLQLRKGVTFHDGTPFNAKAVQFNFDRMVVPATGSKQAGPLLGSYDHTEVIDDRTVKVYFTEPYALFPFALTQPFTGMVSPAAVEKYGNKFNEHLIGSGPFKFVSEIPHTEVVLERNPDYTWAPADLHDGPAYLDKIVFKFILEDETRLATLETEETHIIDEVPPTQVQRLQQNPNYQVFGAPKVGIARGIHFNTQLPPTDDVLVRKAILHAIDRKAINEAVFKEVYPLAYQVLTRGTRFYDKSLEDIYPHNPQKAIKLLEEAGWTEVNTAGYRVKDGKVLELFHATFPGFVAEAPAEIIQAQLKDIGIKFDVNVMTGTAMMDGIAARNSTFNSALIGSYSPDPGLLLRRFYHSSGLGTTNYSHYANKELDQLLEAGLATTDEAKRAEIYAEVQRMIMEEALVAPIYANVSVFGARSTVQGFKFDSYAHPVLLDVQLAK